MTAWSEDETVLERFRQWLQQTHAEAEAGGDEVLGELAEEPDEVVGLLPLVEQFTALRHELKLQTKSARGLEEQSGEAIQALREALAEFRSVQPRERQAAERAARPLVESLIELDEALHRGHQVIESMGRRLLDEAPQQLQDELAELYQQQPRWRRWLCRNWYRASREACRRQTLGQREIFQSLVEGYRLIQKRLQRALQEEDIQRMVCVGQPVDPNRMTVIEAVEAPDQPPGLVVEEVRPGYQWKGKVLRFAEVRAVREPTEPGTPES